MPKAYPITIATTPFNHQYEMIDWLEERSDEGGLIGATMGAGKTLVAIHYSANFFESKPRTTLFIAPKSVAPQVLKQYKQHINAPDHYAYLFTGTSRDTSMMTKAMFVITTWDTLMIEYKQHLTGKLSPLFTRHFDACFADEAHIIKNKKSIRHKAACAINASTKWPITGTPFLNATSDLAALAHFINVHPYNKDTYWSSGDTTKNFHTWASSSYLFIDKQKLYRALKLPPKNFYTHHLPMTTKQYDVYNILKQEAAETVESFLDGTVTIGFADVLAKITRLMQISIHINVVHDSDYAIKTCDHTSAKFDKVIDIINDTPPDEKIIIFSKYTKALILLKQFLQFEIDGDALIFHGGLSSTERQSILRDISLPQNKVILMQINSGGVGIDIIRPNHAIILDPWWNQPIEDQAIDRIYRPGQTRPVHVHRLYSTNSVDMWILAMQHLKLAQASNALLGHKKSGPTKEEVRSLYELHLKPS